MFKQRSGLKMIFCATIFRRSERFNIKTISTLCRQFSTDASATENTAKTTKTTQPTTTTTTKSKIRNISNTIERRTLRVSWSDDTTCEYPHIFLRDNCQCPSCFHPTSKQRLLTTVDSVDVDIQAKAVTHSSNQDALVVTWPDDHKSVFDGNWLRERRFPETTESATPSTLYGITAEPWRSDEIGKHITFIDYEELLSSDEALLNFFENLFMYGLSIIRGVPTEIGVLKTISKRVSHTYFKQTHYGNDFTVKNKPSPNNLAYTAGYLPLHVDLPFYSYQPEVQFLHCIEQSEGQNSGISLLRDGLRAAKDLQSSNPSAFDLLTKVKFKFNDIGKDTYGDYNLQFERPIIGLDGFGQVKSISFNNHVRSSFINVPSDMVKDSYKAYFTLSKIITSDILHYKLSQGEILCFNNTRVLHGRTEFDPQTTSRWLEGCYMDFDELHSIYRVVRERTWASET